MFFFDFYFFCIEYLSLIVVLCVNFESSKVGGVWGFIFKEYNFGCVIVLVIEREKIYVIVGFV